jgi:hypothetical protein
MSSKQPRQRATSSSWPTTTLRAPWSPRVARLAPSVVLDVRPKGLQHVLELDGGSVELALRTLTKGGDRFKCVGLLEDEYVVLLPNTDPLASSPSSQWDISHAAANRQHVRRRRLEYNRRRSCQLWFGATCHGEDAVAFADISADRLYLERCRATDHAPTPVCFTAGIAFNDMAPATGQLSRASLAAGNAAGCRNGRVVRLCRASSYQPTRHRKERAWDALATKDGPRSTGT